MLEVFTKEYFMHNVIPLGLAVLIAVGIIVIGSFYLVSPARVLGSFGLKPPASDANTRAWLRLKGIRDVAAGLAVLTLMLTTDSRTVGILLLFSPSFHLATCVTFVSGGRKATAFSVHGVTCAVMLFAGIWLIHVI
jgi:hypothetical protein